MANLQDHINSAKRTGNIEFFIEERNSDFIISHMPITSGILNPFGTVQAGAMIWLADVTASVLAIEGQTIGDAGNGDKLLAEVTTTHIRA